MKYWLLTASADANLVDYEEIMQSETEPDFWTCYELAEAHGCEFFHIDEINAEDVNECEVLTKANRKEY